MRFPYDPPAGGFDPGNDYGPRAGGGVVSTNHMGVDFGKSSGTPIPNAGDGVVVLAQYYGGYGNCVIVSHGNGLFTLYGHQRELWATVGQRLRFRETVGPVGSTGNSTGPHLHFGTMVGGQTAYIDPVEFMKRYAGYAESALASNGTTPFDNTPQQEEEDEMKLIRIICDQGTPGDEFASTAVIKPSGKWQRTSTGGESRGELEAITAIANSLGIKVEEKHVDNNGYHMAQAFN